MFGGAVGDICTNRYFPLVDIIIFELFCGEEEEEGREYLHNSLINNADGGGSVVVTFEHVTAGGDGANGDSGKWLGYRLDQLSLVGIFTGEGVGGGGGGGNDGEVGIVVDDGGRGVVGKSTQTPHSINSVDC